MKILTHYDRLDSMYYSLIDSLRYLAFFSLVIISMIISVSFYISAVESFYDKIMLGIAAFSLEIVKVYSLIYSEYIWFSIKQKSIIKFKDIFKTLRSYTLFTALTLLSIVASISFAQASIYSTIEEVQIVLNKEADVLEKGNPLIDAKNRLLENKQSQLEMLNSRIAELPSDYVTSSLKLSTEVNKLNDDIYKISEEIANLELNTFKEKITTTKNMSEKKATYNRFYLLGKPLGLTETEALFAFLTLFAILLEMGIIATAPAPEKRSIRELLEKKTDIKSNTFRKKTTKKVNKSKKQTEVKVKKAPIDLIALEPKVEVTKKIKKVKKRRTSIELLEDLYERGSIYLKSPSQASYTSGISVESYLRLLDKLAKLKPSKDSTYLLTKDSKGYKMNYSFNYTKSILKERK